MERYTERNELISELHILRNQLIAQLAEVNMAIMRENNHPEAKARKTVTLQTQQLLNHSRRVDSLWSTKEYQQQAFAQSDVNDV